MRLLFQKASGVFDRAKPFAFEEYPDDKCPEYAILSHRWCNDEPNFQDIVKGTGRSKAGYDKLMFCAEWAARDGYKFFWVDTVCIDKTNYTELTRALTSMYSWYAKSSVCYVYMSDVGSRKGFSRSTWFSRGWTLQELIAPSKVLFFDCHGDRLGSRDNSLRGRICKKTSIPPEAFGGSDLSEFSVEEKFSWIKGRETEEAEDLAYCLQGIFDVNLLPIYGEGRRKAFRRLRAAIDEQSSSTAEKANLDSTGIDESFKSCFRSSYADERVHEGRSQVRPLSPKSTAAPSFPKMSLDTSLRTAPQPGKMTQLAQSRLLNTLRPERWVLQYQPDSVRHAHVYVAQSYHKVLDEGHEARQEDARLTVAMVSDAGDNCSGIIQWQRASSYSSKKIATCSICWFECRVWEEGEPPQLSDGCIVPQTVIWNRFHRASKLEFARSDLLSKSLPMFTCRICKNGRNLFYPELCKHLAEAHVTAELSRVK